jgi:pimeloyl-ACP methyl ester carboxylesterase
VQGETTQEKETDMTTKIAARKAAAIEPLRIDVPQSQLDDLADRLNRVRWANELPADQVTDGIQTGPVQPGWEYGVPLEYVQRLVEYWRNGYDWRTWEARLNEFPQFTTEIDGQNIHFLHVRSPEPEATPLILTHGWPNSVVEFLDVIGPLTDPRAHGGDPADAFHVVIPSLPGFGFSGPTTQKGWDRHRTARAWAELMKRLGYDRFGAHGNDVGSYVAPELGRIAPDEVIGVHVTQLFSFPSGDPAELVDLNEQEAMFMEFLQMFGDEMAGYAKLQETAPQNLAHALADSPTGQLAWIAQLLAACDDGSDGARELRVGLHAAAPVRGSRPRQHRVVERVRARWPLVGAGCARPAGRRHEGVLPQPPLTPRPTATSRAASSRCGR